MPPIFILDSRIIANYDTPTIFCANLKHGCPNVAGNILKTPLQSREIYAVGVDPRLEKQNKTSFNFLQSYHFKGNNIYDPNAWHTLSQGEEHE